MTRRVLSEFVIDKIAAVDRPCQEHAVTTIMKRADPEVIEKVEDEAAVKKAAVDAASRGLLKLKLDLMSAQVEKAGMIIEGYAGRKKPKSRNPMSGDLK